MESTMHKFDMTGALAVTVFVLVICVFAAAQNGGQATVISGFASNRMQVAGATALADAPLVNTPSVTLDAAPLSAPNGLAATLTWYGPGAESAAQPEHSEAPPLSAQGKFMNAGVGTSQDSEGVALLMAENQVNGRHTAARVYTNRDVAQLVEELHESTGLVKYGDRTKHLY
jgi:hypothetical protein